MIQCKRYLVHGHVQGVFFRGSTQEQAQRLGVTGWVRNTPDGDVELLACGEVEQLHQLSTWLWCGPPRARVEKVTSKVIDGQQPPSGFRVR